MLPRGELERGRRSRAARAPRTPRTAQGGHDREADRIEGLAGSRQGRAGQKSWSCGDVSRSMAGPRAAPKDHRDGSFGASMLRGPRSAPMARSRRSSRRQRRRGDASAVRQQPRAVVHRPGVRGSSSHADHRHRRMGCAAKASLQPSVPPSARTGPFAASSADCNAFSSIGSRSSQRVMQRARSASSHAGSDRRAISATRERPSNRSRSSSDPLVDRRVTERAGAGEQRCAVQRDRTFPVACRRSPRGTPPHRMRRASASGGRRHAAPRRPATARAAR